MMSNKAVANDGVVVQFSSDLIEPAFDKLGKHAPMM